MKHERIFTEGQANHHYTCKCGFDHFIDPKLAEPSTEWKEHQKLVEAEQRGKETASDILSSLSKKLEEGERINLLDKTSEGGFRHERMLRAMELISLALRIGLEWDDQNWKEFDQVILDDHKLQALIGDMRQFLESREGPDTCPGHDEVDE